MLKKQKSTISANWLDQNKLLWHAVRRDDWSNSTSYNIKPVNYVWSNGEKHKNLIEQYKALFEFAIK